MQISQILRWMKFKEERITRVIGFLCVGARFLLIQHVLSKLFFCWNLFSFNQLQPCSHQLTSGYPLERVEERVKSGISRDFPATWIPLTCGTRRFKHRNGDNTCKTSTMGTEMENSHGCTLSGWTWKLLLIWMFARLEFIGIKLIGDCQALESWVFMNREVIHLSHEAGKGFLTFDALIVEINAWKSWNFPNLSSLVSNFIFLKVVTVFYS